MRVAAYPRDRGGCGHHRVLHPARALRARGRDVRVEPPIYEIGVIREGRRFMGGVEVEADVAVFQRVVDRAGVESIPLMQSRGVAVVIDVDDDLDALPDDHPYLAHVDGSDPDHNRGWLHAACDLADMVTVTTAPLAERYAPHGRVAVLPNRVPERWLDIRVSKGNRPRVGWSGRPTSHRGDWSPLTGMGGVVDEAGAVFVSMDSSAKATFDLLGVPDRCRRARPWRPLGRGYEQEVASWTVGLAPLLDNPFNRAKSGLKALEYAALGVPFVASRMPEYEALGAGLLMSTDKPVFWADVVKHLLSNPEQRQEMVDRGRAIARDHTVEGHSDEWWEAWTEAHRHRSGKRKAAA